MKNIRRANLSKEFLEQFNISTECPTPNSLFFQLWSLNAKKTSRHIMTSFNDVIINGDLNFISYGNHLHVSECYRFHMAHNFIVAANKARERTLKVLLQQLFHTSKVSLRSIRILWGKTLLKDKFMIKSNPYLKFLRKVATNFDPIYSLIPFMAREHLAYWIPLQLGKLDHENPYSCLINYKYDTTLIYAIGNFLETYLHNHNALDTLTARHLYSQTIDFEIQSILKQFPQHRTETKIL